MAAYLIRAFISCFTTGAADQSLIESPRDGEILNVAREFQNSYGSLRLCCSLYQAVLWPRRSLYSHLHADGGCYYDASLSGLTAQMVHVTGYRHDMGFRHDGEVPGAI